MSVYPYRHVVTEGPQAGQVIVYNSAVDTVVYTPGATEYIHTNALAATEVGIQDKLELTPKIQEGFDAIPTYQERLAQA